MGAANVLLQLAQLLGNLGLLGRGEGRVLHTLAGRGTDAAASAKLAVELDPALPEAYFAQSRVAEAEGDAAKALELRTRAFTLAAADPLYASLVVGDPG